MDDWEGRGDDLQQTENIVKVHVGGAGVDLCDRVGRSCALK